VANPVVRLPVVESGFGKTLRKDAWWLGPALTFSIISAFLVYATCRAFENNYYEWDRSSRRSIRRSSRRRAPDPLPHPGPPHLAGPATSVSLATTTVRLLPLLRDGPARVRRRRAERSPVQRGDQASPLPESPSLRALPRRAFLVFLWSDFVRSLFWKDGFSVHVGSIVLLLNCTFLSLYTFSCHSFRHLVGGGLNTYAGRSARSAISCGSS